MSYIVFITHLLKMICHFNTSKTMMDTSERRDGDLVGAGRQLGNGVIAGTGRRRFVDHTGVGVSGFDRSAGDNSVCGIGNCSGDCTGALGHRRSGTKQQSARNRQGSHEIPL